MKLETSRFLSEQMETLYRDAVAMNLTEDVAIKFIRRHMEQAYETARRMEAAP